MAKEDLTQRLLNELKQLTSTNTSLKNVITEYARTTASTMANTAAAIQTTNQTGSAIAELSKTFNDIKEALKVIGGNLIPRDEKTNIASLTGPEKGRYASIAKIFNSVMKVSAISKIIQTKNKENVVQKIESEKEEKNNDISLTGPEKGRYASIAKIFNSVMKVSAISKILAASEKNKLKAEKETKEKDLFKPDNLTYNSKEKENKKKKDEEKSDSGFLNLLETIPIIGSLIRAIRGFYNVVKGLGVMLFAASPILSLLSHFFTDKIAPWQGTIDLLAKIKLMGGKTTMDIVNLMKEKVITIVQWPFKFLTEKMSAIFGNLKIPFTQASDDILAKIKLMGGKITMDIVNLMKEKAITIVQWPFKFLTEKMPTIFGNLKIPFTQASDDIAKVATAGVEALAKGGKEGILSKLLGFGGKSLKFLAKRLPILGGILGAYFAYDRFLKGDYFGSLIEIASAIASCFPGVGTAISIGLGVWQAWRDITRTPEEEAQFEVNKTLPGKIWEGIKDTFNGMYDWVANMLTGAWTWLKDLWSSFKNFFSSKKKIEMPNINDQAKKLSEEQNKQEKLKYQEELKFTEKQKLLVDKAKIASKYPKIAKGNDGIMMTPAVTKEIAKLTPTDFNNLPEVKKPTTTVETPKPIVIQPNITPSAEDIKLMNVQNLILAEQTELLQVIAKKTGSSQTNNVQMPLDNDIRLKLNVSDSRRNFLNSTVAATNLMGGIK